jgi:hypothetical protein
VFLVEINTPLEEYIKIMYQSNNRLRATVKKIESFEVT